MKESTMKIVNDLSIRYPILASCQDKVVYAIEMIILAFKNGHKLMTCGNGGSAADALHIVGELMKSFNLPRRLTTEDQEKIKTVSHNADYINANLQGTLPAISLVNEVALKTAYANDMKPDLDFAQQVYGYGNAGDVLIAISTSGNSKNVIYATEVANIKGVKVVGLTGATGGNMKDICDVLINVPETEIYKIQELHLPVYHTICLALENEFFGD